MTRISIDPDRLEVVLLDLGGVVFDFDWDRALDHWSSCSGVPVATLEERFSKVGDYERFERGELTADEYFAILDHQLGIGIGNDEIAKGWNAIFGDLVPGITEAIAAVKASRYRLAALSNTNAAHASTFAARFVTALVDIPRILASHELGFRKPEPACYAAACEHLATEPERIVFFDDSADNVSGARAAGMQAVLVRDPDDIGDALAAMGILGMSA